MYIFVAVTTCAWIYLTCYRRKRKIMAKPSQPKRDTWRTFLLEELHEASLPLQQQCLDELSSIPQADGSDRSEYGDDTGMDGQLPAASQGDFNRDSPGIRVRLRQEHIVELSDAD